MNEQLEQVLTQLDQLASPENAAGMARFGIRGAQVLGVSVRDLRALARPYKKDHALAQALWETGIHEARLLASIIADPQQVTKELMERWVLDFDSWDLCDQCCMNLFDKTPFAWQKAIAWSAHEAEFVRRAGFALMAALAMHDKHATDEQFEPFFTCIREQSTDDRNFVKKAVNWALRQIGKRNTTLRSRALAVARDLAESDARPARWIGRDAVNELEGRE
jgi:3-methyladenine DNA glycosylase AlkD